MNSCEEMSRFLGEQSDYLIQLRLMDPMEMYRDIVNWGKELSPFSEEEKKKAFLVPGCLSEVYISGECRDGRMYYRACADTQIIAGMLKILFEAVNGLTPDEVCLCAEESIVQFSKAIDIQSTLTPTRANAFANIVRHMRLQAERFRSHP